MIHYRFAATAPAGRDHALSERAFVRFCFVPLAVLVVAFFALPMARLVLVGASGDQGLRA